MTAGTTGTEPLDRAIQDYNAWLTPLADRLHTSERRLAHRALRATLHALRDRMGPDHVASFAAQLPTVIRAIFFEGYQPSAIPAREHSRGAFLEQVHAEGVEPLDIEQIERTVKAALAVMSEHLDHALIDTVTSTFPDEFADLWPQTPVEWDSRERKRHGPLRAGELASRGLRTKTSAKLVTGVDEVDLAIQVATQWVDALVFRMNATSRTAWTALAATLRAIREQLSVEQAIRFAASLPLPLQGVYYEGWQPTSMTPVQTRSGFVQRIELTSWQEQDISAEHAVKAAFGVIARKVPAAEMTAIVPSLPKDLNTLWPDEPAPYTDLSVMKAVPLAESVEREPAPQPPARGGQNIRRARGRVPGQATRDAIASSKPGKRAH